MTQETTIFDFQAEKEIKQEQKKELTTFEVLHTKNVNDKVEKKEGLSYLSWSYAWAEVKKIDNEANYVIHETTEGLPFFSSVLGIDCKVSVTIKGLTYTMRLPVMNGANKAMKTESYTYTTKYGEKSVEAATMFDVNKTIMRCLVKAIAMHGLGLYIYSGEDLPETTNDTVETKNTVKTDEKQSVKVEDKKVEQKSTENAKLVKVEAFGYKDDSAKAILKELGFKNFKDNEGKWHTQNSYVKFDTLPEVPGITFKIV